MNEGDRTVAQDYVSTDAFPTPQLLISLESVCSPRRGRRAQPTLSVHFPAASVDTSFPQFMEITARRDPEADRPLCRSQSSEESTAASDAQAAASGEELVARGGGSSPASRRHSFDFLPDA
eukprot:CAMPEP_0180780740 /NCGR_PEP_ID=MMETSP1038_2-20121128/47194_1 /TAXON_ID=632150 /ORGANISM="Azadinium spinosum, Strain 3D9" /LENGTH=120 /DNA_ID=CAMNT_0022816347 /DNA_START=52 /DNA_END=410 /DNA_ORIENTATION=+